MINYTQYEKDLNQYLEFGAGKYVLGKYRFSTKEHIIKFSRSLLDFFQPNTTIEYEPFVSFVHDMFKNHPEYDSKKTLKPLFNIVLNKEFYNYTIFEIEYTDNSKCAFGNRTAIKDLKETYNKWQRKHYKNKSKNFNI